MKISLQDNLSTVDRSFRIIIGFGLMLSIMLVPMQVELIAAIALTAIYPLLTGLMAIDPVVAVFENILHKPFTVKKSNPVGAM